MAAKLAAKSKTAPRPMSPLRPASVTPSPRTPGGASSAASDVPGALPDLEWDESDIMADEQDTPKNSQAPRERAPADRKGPKSHKAGAGKRERVRQSLLAYHGMAANVVAMAGNSPDAVIIATSGADATEAWMAGYDSDPRVRRVLEAITISGPWFVPLVIAYGSMAVKLMSNHGVSPAALFARTPAPEPQSVPVDSMPSEPGPYSGPPTTALGTAIPDEGLPADIEFAIREMARQTGRPYDELRHEALIQIAQAQMAANGHQTGAAPAALGALIAE